MQWRYGQNGAVGFRIAGTRKKASQVININDVNIQHELHQQFELEYTETRFLWEVHYQQIIHSLYLLLSY